MACVKKVNEAKKHSDELDKQLKIWHRKYEKIVKLLLLGTGESGKTTILKQMKILHISGYTVSERREKVAEILQNVHESIYDIVRNMRLLNPPLDLENSNNEKSLKYIVQLGPDGPSTFSEEYFQHVEALWKDRSVQMSYRRSNEYQLIDSAKYFLDQLETLKRPDYVPSDQDILRSRKTTTEIQKIEFSLKIPKRYGGGSQTFWMFDVGGQRGARKKWIQVFDGIRSVLFLVACSDFDQTLREQTSTNRLKEALILFENMWYSRFLQESGIILFLNKQDVLMEKIKQGKSIRQNFPEYDSYIMNPKDGRSDDEYLRTRSFIRDLFLGITTKKTPAHHEYVVFHRVSLPIEDVIRKRGFYYHFTTATDTNNIKMVFEDVHSMILAENLSVAGLE
ncbi:guanine nucleotide-binding protein G(f) subunit alpha [Schistocerca americana]|uniref:guanine nucleotide-binding protein G(f) subunit alpha n=1 Tax=Schistocerca americana TaxID=7009 RepID=UPI001F4F51C6|nr:guanine nucleotide-binding protein G(f) subunit alpha [Schistocerca americana]